MRRGRWPTAGRAPAASRGVRDNGLVTSSDAPIRLLVMDLDGTLLPRDQRLSPRTIEAVRGAVGRGIVVSIATGRMAMSLLPYARELGLREPLIALGGAAIHAPAGDGMDRPGRLLRHRPLAPGAAREAVRWCLANGLRPHLNNIGRMIMAEDDPNAEDYSWTYGGRPLVVPDLVTWITRPVSKVIAVGPPGLPAAIVADARRRFAGRAHATVSHPEFLEFFAPEVSKGGALRWLARRRGIPLVSAMAIGDQLNDLEMIEAAGFGVAMPHGPAELRSAARLVAPPLDEDGAAQVIEALLLGGGSPMRRRAAAG